MTRRGLFAALAALPFVGRFVPRPSSPQRLVLDWDRKTEARTLTFEESGGPVQTFITRSLRTDTYHHGAGKRVTVHFARDATGRWFEFARHEWRHKGPTC
jgi:hypothetical protein